MSRGFLKKINNRHLLIKSTDYVNMGGCRSAPPYSKKKVSAILILYGASPHSPHSPLGRRRDVIAPKNTSFALRFCQGQALCSAPLTTLSLKLAPLLRTPFSPRKGATKAVEVLPKTRSENGITKLTYLFIMEQRKKKFP